MSTLHLDGCDGGDLSIDSVCCEENDYHSCPHDEGCIDYKIKGIKNLFLELKDLITCYKSTHFVKYGFYK